MSLRIVAQALSRTTSHQLHTSLSVSAHHYTRMVQISEWPPESKF